MLDIWTWESHSEEKKIRLGNGFTLEVGLEKRANLVVNPRRTPIPRGRSAEGKQQRTP